MKALLLFTYLFATASFAAPMEVKISFIEALSHKDTTSSKRFRKEYEMTIEKGLAEANKKTSKCNYKLVSNASFFESTDSLQAMETGKKEAESGSWLIVSPRRSNHYLLLTKGTGNTPTLSTMASAKEVFELPAHNLTMSPSNHTLAKVAAKEAKSRSKKNTYISIVKEGCLSCEDFSKGFDIAAKDSLKKLKSFTVIGDEPDVKKISEELTKLKPSFVLLPNYSKLSAYLMSKLHPVLPEAFFVGGDGWGDKNFGFVQNNPAQKPAFGITVRGFIPTEQAVKLFKLGSAVKSSGYTPKSGTSLSLLKAIDGVTELLCKYKPKSKNAFADIYKKHGKSLFNSPWGVGVYHLENNVITYDHKVSVN